MCNMLIVDKLGNPVVDQMIHFINKHFPNVILLPITQTKKEVHKLCTNQKIEIAIINVDVEEDCFEIHKELLLSNPNTKSILYSNYESFSIAQKALRYGLIDYLVEPINTDFIYALDRAIQSINQISLLNIEKSGDSSPSLNLKHQILRYIHENYNEHLTLDTLANSLHLSKYYTSRLIKNTLGMTFSMCLLIYRLEVAKKELSTSDLSINEISSKVGFNDPNYFSKQFKKITSYTPIQYRNTYKGIATIIDSRVQI